MAAPGARMQASESKGGLLWVLVTVVTLHGAGLYFFTAGFLLTRFELPGSSSCDARDSHDWRPPRPSTGCWGPRLFNKTVIVVIDALRYDMAMDADECPPGPSFHCGKIPALQDILKRRDGASTLLRFQADAPTTTMQRLKGLMTGGLPTFIDVGSSFGAEEVTEDNLLRQLQKNGRRVVAVGDDTWTQLFQNQLADSHVFPSLNVKDLHGVDNSIKALLPGLLRSPEKWDVLILHFLGVDHVGHVHGVDSPHMEAKLGEMDEVVGQVAGVLEAGATTAGGVHADTLLVVMGDHGQTLHGDHGGGTPEEVDSALFALSLRPPPLHRVASLRTASDSGSETATMPQVDFAPTMALLLGVPPPFGSVGKVSPDLWSVAPRAWEEPPGLAGAGRASGGGEGGRGGGGDGLLAPWVGGYVAALRGNSWQVQHYLEHYDGAGAQARLLPAEQFGRCARLRYEAVARGPGGRGHGGGGSAGLKAERDALLAHLGAAARLARSQFSQFRPAPMAYGILLLSLALVIQAAAVFASPASLLPSRATVAVSVCASATAGAASQVPSLERLHVTAAAAAIAGAAVLRDVAAARKARAPAPPGLARGGGGGGMVTYCAALAAQCVQSDIVVWALAVAHAASQLSNSYIVAEGSVIRFNTATLGALCMLSSLRRRRGLAAPAVMLVAGAALCEAGARHDASGSASGAGSLLQDLAVLAARGLSPHVLLPIFLHRFGLGLERRALAAGVQGTTARMSYRLSRGASWTMHVGVALWWTCQRAPESGAACRLWLPRAVYALFAAAGAAVAGLNAWGARGGGEDRAVRAARFALEVLFLCSAPVAMVLGGTGPLALLLATCYGASFALTRSPGGGGAATFGPAASGLAWSWLMLALFFGTAHQCTFGALQFTAGFIGFDDFNFWLSGGLLAVNTFAAHILLPASIPLLTLAGEAPGGDPDGFRSTALAFGLARTLTSTAAAVLAAVERRHLMVWALFAPKYVFEGCGLLAVDVIMVLVCALLF